jgi:hypothetical protein
LDSSGSPAATPQKRRIFSAPGSRILGNSFSAFLAFRVGPLQDLLQVALEPGGGDVRDFLPAQDARLGAHAAHRRQRHQHLARSSENGIGCETHLGAQSFEYGGAPVVGQQIAGILTED